MELSRYVGYVKNERVKIQFFLGSLPQIFRERIEFVNLPGLDESIIMTMHWCDQRKGK